ncbi:eukaryotic translation initiation factor 2-alpha kinase 1-like isoform X1 [Linepithema humile]|uniref:eukaryotic translation initiation factor 2-alpha kinase 1-like isoform X1 n=1 Tax=Linepithema humile TaxID=83485 RepID=UPI00351F775B
MEQVHRKENLESIDCEKTENMEEENHPWNSLSTVTTFDEGFGNNTISTLCLNNISKTETSGQIAQRCAPSSVLIGSLIQQLCTIFESDKIRRNKLYYAICDKLHESQLIDDSYNMMELDVVRGHYQRALYRLVTIARNVTGSESTLQIPRALVSELSRYHREFRELNFIAGGGFGKVFRALHRLDGTEYAIKKIMVSSKCMETIEQYLNEVKTLAKLNHPNIVPYKAAWIETTFLPLFVSNVPSTNRSSYKSRASNCTQESKSCNSQSIKDSHSNRYSDRQDILFDKENHTIGMYINAEIEQQSEVDSSVRDLIATSFDVNERFDELNSSTNIIGKRINKESTQKDSEETDSDVVSFRNSENNENLDITIEDNTDSPEEDRSSSYEESNGHQELCAYNGGTSNGNGQYITLYIQMALCEQTLEEWMRCRINTTPHAIIRAVLQQILLGIDYIHSQKIVHHDIKPSNIFISTSGQLQIQLGDFGLACPQRKNHHSIIGTHMYAAPEQLQGMCDPKSDVYSVGIVLTELSIPTQTLMELSSIISCLKCGNIETLTKERRKWAQIITQMIQEDPAERPSTNQLLQDLKDDKDMLITELKNTVVGLEKDLHDKNNTIQELEETIALLKEEVKKHRQMPLENTIK